MGEKEEVVGVLATGLLHYLLTNALISSQRKVTYNDNELDIVIPDTKTLEKDPKKLTFQGECILVDPIPPEGRDSWGDNNFCYSGSHKIRGMSKWVIIGAGAAASAYITSTATAVQVAGAGAAVTGVGTAPGVAAIVLSKAGAIAIDTTIDIGVAAINYWIGRGAKWPNH